MTAPDKMKNRRAYQVGVSVGKAAALDEIERLREELDRLKNPPEEYCAKCGSPKSNHPFRHPFASMHREGTEK